MDSEEQHKIEQAYRAGKPQTDEGPYYHESWWEAYKGSVKGKMGGAVIGAVVGAAIGAVAALVVALVASAPVTLAAVGMMAAGFSAAGLVYGAHEFADVGRVTGAVAAAHEKSEARMKSFENGKFSELKQEIGEIKSMLAGKDGKPVSAATPPVASLGAHDGHRTQHCDDEHCPPQKSKPVFWKVAAIGAGIGLAAGAVLAGGGGAEHVIEGLGFTAGSDAGVMAASMTTLGLFGASFGINRDMFRKVFDKTDLLFKGIVPGEENVVPPSPAIVQAVQRQHGPIEPAITTIVYENGLDYPKSDTFHRDRVVASARVALLNLDHTKAIQH